MSDSNDLDFRLYDWLSEQDERHAEARFSSYFKAAFPTICHYVRSLGQSGATAEDIAQQALIKLFNHLGRARRLAAEEIRSATSGLRPIDAWGPMHARLLHVWLQQLTAFIDAAIGFRITQESQENVKAWKGLRNEINGQIDPLRRRAADFLDEVRARVEPNLLALLEDASPREQAAEEATPNKEDESAELSTDVGTPSLTAETSGFASMLSEYAERCSCAQVNSALGHVGVCEFVTGTASVHKHLPPLAVPSNGLLYTIARRQLIDTLRAKKREDLIADIPDPSGSSVLDELELDTGGPQVDAADGPSAVRLPDQVEDEERESELQSRYVAFVDHLRNPLTRAEGTLASASTHGRSTAEGQRVASLQAKSERLMAVLGALREAPQPTEEQIAKRLGLTRNQVKYAIERIRHEFNHYFPDLAGHSHGRRKSQGGRNDAPAVTDRAAPRGSTQHRAARTGGTRPAQSFHQNAGCLVMSWGRPQGGRPEVPDARDEPRQWSGRAQTAIV